MKTFYSEDGRECHEITTETQNADGSTTIHTEIHCEPVIEKKLTQRIVETKKPITTQRTIETLNDAGEVVEQKVESTNEPQCKLVDHISAYPIQAQGTSDCDCFVSQKDMQEGFAMLASALQNKAPETKLTVQSVVGDRIEEMKKKWYQTDIVSVSLYGCIAAMSAVFIYVVFLM